MPDDVKVQGGRKDDSEKPRMDLIPPRPMVEIAKVLTWGAQHYGEYNWAQGLQFSRLKGALERHLAAWWTGEELDAKTGLPHLAHAGCCLLFMMDLRHTRPDMDNRPRGLIARAFEEMVEEMDAEADEEEKTRYVGGFPRSGPENTQRVKIPTTGQLK